MSRWISWVTLSLLLGAYAGPASAAAPADEPPFLPKTLAGALTAARNLTCNDCVEVVRWDFVDGERVRVKPARSARRGIVQISAADDSDKDGVPDASGAVLTMGYRGQTWDVFYGSQNGSPHVGMLPSRAWVCPTRRKSVKVRSGPDRSHPAVRRVSTEARARAMRFRLYRPELNIGKRTRPGYGWYKLKVRGTTGWVRLNFVGNAQSCELLRLWRKTG